MRNYASLLGLTLLAIAVLLGCVLLPGQAAARHISSLLDRPQTILLEALPQEIVSEPDPYLDELLFTSLDGEMKFFVNKDNTAAPMEDELTPDQAAKHMEQLLDALLEGDAAIAAAPTLYPKAHYYTLCHPVTKQTVGYYSMELTLQAGPNTYHTISLLIGAKSGKPIEYRRSWVNALGPEATFMRVCTVFEWNDYTVFQESGGPLTSPWSAQETVYNGTNTPVRLLHSVRVSQGERFQFFTGENVDYAY